MKTSITLAAALLATFAISSAAQAGSSTSATASSSGQQTATTASNGAGSAGADQRSDNSTSRFMYLANGSDQGEGVRGGNPDSEAICTYAGIGNAYFFNCQQ